MTICFYCTTTNFPTEVGNLISFTYHTAALRHLKRPVPGNDCSPCLSKRLRFLHPYFGKWSGKFELLSRYPIAVRLSAVGIYVHPPVGCLMTWLHATGGRWCPPLAAVVQPGCLHDNNFLCYYWFQAAGFPGGMRATKSWKYLHQQNSFNPNIGINHNVANTIYRFVKFWVRYDIINLTRICLKILLRINFYGGGIVCITKLCYM